MNLINEVIIFPWDDIFKLILARKKKESIYARKCEVRHVSKDEGKQFLNRYHLQNYCRCSILLGLYYNDELISIMTFGKPRYNKNYDFEIIRYCSSYSVIGGVEKLFKHFLDEYQPKNVISYCDNAKFSGDTYLKLGFKLKSKGYPSKHWYNYETKEHYTDALLRQQGYSRLIHHKDAKDDDLKTRNNKELMLADGFVEVYDCGQSTYIYERVH